MIRITNGRVYDPRNGVNGEVRDIWVRDGRIVSAAEVDRERARVIDARGMIVMPGGVDLHSHIAGPKVNAGRKFRPEDHRADVRPRTRVTRSGVGYTVPTTFVTGYRYAEMGYTTVMEAAVPPLLARHAHDELNDIPLLDKGAYVVMGNNHFIMERIRAGEREKVRDYVAWLLGAAKGYAIKIVNPGGVENWKWGRNVSGLDDEVIGFGITPRQILTTLAWVADELHLPHGPHIHCNRLGQPGNARTTMETIEALEGRRAHLCHLQFLSYEGGDGRPFRSGAESVARSVNEHPNITVDIGQVIFGEATTMTSDGPLQYRLHMLSGNKWLNHDIEEETGGGVVPMTFRRRNLVNAIQWCVGLELFLLIEDPWRAFLTTDHPNGGPFVAYPQVIRLLMDRDYRAEVMESLPRQVRRRTSLLQLKREYSLYEIAIVTRAGPARALGLERKGHLGVGADADIAVYEEKDNPEEMFSRARYVIKGGEVIVEDGEIVRDSPGRTFYVAPPWEPEIESLIKDHFERCYTIAFANYPVQEEYLPLCEVVPCA